MVFSQEKTPEPVEVSGFEAMREYLRLLRDPVLAVRDIYRRRGPLVFLGPVAFGEPTKIHALAFGPAFNRQILSDPTSFRPTGMLLRGPKNSAQRRVRFGLFRMTGAQHRQQRQLIMPAFHKTTVRGYHDLMVSNTEAVLEHWRPGERRDIYLEMRTLALRIASAVLFSHDPAEGLPIGRLIVQWIRRSFAGVVWGFPVNLPGTPYHGLLRSAERIEERILAMIARRRSNPGAYRDALALLMEARDEQNHSLTDAEVVGQSAILFMAGFETSATALTWTLFLLAQHPAVMRELMNELDAVLGGNPPKIDQLAQLPFLLCVIKESLRILPPVPYTMRTTIRRVMLGPVRLFHGTRVLFSHYLTHHLPELYPEPERFRPERWREIDPNQFEYLPFGAGPRMCVGAAFAMQVLQVSLAIMLQRFRFAVVPGTRIDQTMRIAMEPRYGMPMSIFANDRNFASSEVHGQIREMVTLP